jgi:hypothetical protein
MLSGCNDSRLHQEISPDEIFSIEVESVVGNPRSPEDFDTEKWELNDDEIRTFVSWFNSCTSIENNRALNGVGTKLTSTNIYTKNKSISLVNDGDDFWVIVYMNETNKVISYWAKQNEINEFLDRIERPGCRSLINS